MLSRAVQEDVAVPDRQANLRERVDAFEKHAAAVADMVAELASRIFGPSLKAAPPPAKNGNPSAALGYVALSLDRAAGDVLAARAALEELLDRL